MTTIGSRATGLHRDSTIVDAHNDLLMLVTRREPAVWAAYFRDRVLHQLHAGGVDVQVLPVFVDDEFQPELALRQMLRMLEAAHRVAEGCADQVALCETADQIETVVASGRIALVLALEGCAPLGESVELIELVRRLGVRIASLTHLGRTAFGDGSAEDAAGSRLTSLGVEALGEMERTGITLDVSHLGRAGVDHVLEICRRPVMATHSSTHAVREHHRNLRDEHLRAIAAGGGVVCLNFYSSFVSVGPATMSDLMDHVEHAVDVMRADHVGIGPDFIHEYYAELSPAQRLLMLGSADNIETLPQLEGPGGLPLFTQALLERGFDESTVVGILGGNMMSFFAQNLR